MDERFGAFIMADPLFFDVLHAKHTGETSDWTPDRPVPDGWEIREQDDWLVLDNGEQSGPLQGWKIHISACLDNGYRVLEKVWDYCVPRNITFKYLRSRHALLARVGKYAPRGYSGKFVTIYPADDAQCELILRELNEILDGEPGPYILSDLRYGNGPLYVRYGAFRNRSIVSAAGEIIGAIEDETGTLVADRRGPVFHVPSWVTLPEFLVPHWEARNAQTVAELPYKITRALHFSNGGGIYVGTDTETGAEVVLKEGRPHAGIDANGLDAVQRVDHEGATLRALAGIPGIPEVYGLHTVGGHRFLAMEFVDGRPLNREIAQRCPLIRLDAGPEDFADYTRWALHVFEQVETIIHGIHEHGYVYGDLHLFNVMVREDEAVRLLDFEVAAPVGEMVRPGLGNQGFTAPRGVTGFGLDDYALACLRLALFLPMTSLLWLSRGKAVHYAEIIKEHFPTVPDEFLQKALDAIVPADARPAPAVRIEPDSLAWPQLRGQLTKAIVASATPERDDRLFPGDFRQFTPGGGINLVHGAAGVLYALSVTGAGRYPQFEEWLLAKARRPERGTPPGLYDGLHGVAYALDHLGYAQEAVDLLDMALRENWRTLGNELYSGLAGIGLNLLHFADRTGEPGLRQGGLNAADMVAQRLGDVDSVPEISGGTERPQAGLMKGSSGVALLLIRAYDETGDSAYLDQAAVALRQDLRRCVTRTDGVLEVNEGWRTMPYLDVGSVGIGLVLDEYLRRRDDDEFRTASAGALLAAKSTLYILPGLFPGRAGILYYLAARSAAPASDPLVAKQVRGLSWHGLPYGDGLAFPGVSLLRLSMDLSTGTAGVLLALGAALHDEPVTAPLLATAKPFDGSEPERRAESQAPAPAGAGR